MKEPSDAFGKLERDENDAISAWHPLVDLMVEQQADIPFVTIRAKRDAIARYGLRVGDVMEAIETAFLGRVISKVLEGQTSFDLVVRYPQGVLTDVQAVRETLITTPAGARLPLHALAEVRRDRGPNTVSRENVQRKIVVSANVAERDLHSVVDDIRARIAQDVALPRRLSGRIRRSVRERRASHADPAGARCRSHSRHLPAALRGLSLGARRRVGDAEPAPGADRRRGGQALSSCVDGSVYKTNFWEVAFQAYDPFYPSGILAAVLRSEQSGQQRRRRSADARRGALLSGRRLFGC